MRSCLFALDLTGVVRRPVTIFSCGPVKVAGVRRGGGLNTQDRREKFTVYFVCVFNNYIDVKILCVQCQIKRI